MTVSISWEAGSDATTVDFSPTTPADWSPVPADVQDALDQLASELAGITGAFVYRGNWDANANNPTLTSGVGTQGDVYFVSVAGTTNLDGITDWQVGDFAVFNGTVWQKWDNTDLVTSVNGKTGAVVLVSADITDTVTKPASSTDHAVARYDGVTGKLIENSSIIIADSGAITNIGTDGTYQTEDKTSTTNSVAVSLESGATVDGNSGKASLKAGLVSGTGTRGDAEVSGKNVEQKIDGPGDKFKVISGSNEIFTLEEFIAVPFVFSTLKGNATKKGSAHLVYPFDNTVDALTIYYDDIAASLTSPVGGTGYWASVSAMVIYGDTADLYVTTTEKSGATNSQKLWLITGAVEDGVSGDIEIKTGSASGTGSRGDVIIDSPNWAVTAAGNISGNNLSGTNTGDEVAATESVAGIAELATQAETDAGTDDTRIVTPLKLRATPEYLSSVTKTTTPYAALATDNTIVMNVAGVSVVNLPSAASVSGKVYTVKRYSAAGPNTVTVTPAGGDTIDNAANFPLNSVNASVTFQSDGGTNWIVL